MDIDALPPTKQGPRKRVRREESQNFELFDHFPLTALCAEQLKRAKSNLEVQKWAFFSSYLLAKEENFGLGTSSKHKNVTKISEEINKPPRLYSGPITRSRARLMSQSNINDSSISTTSSNTMETQTEEGHTSSSSITQDELKTLIADGIKEFQASINLPVHGCRKPYPAHYDTVPFPTGSIHTWDDLQRAFLAQFVSSKKKVSIIDLVDARQKSNESVNDFITRWRSLNLQCSEKLTEQSAIQMCSNNLLLEIATFIGTAEPHSFDALVSKASNVERQISRQKSTMQRGRSKEGSKKLTLEEKKKTKYSFHDDDVEGIFNELMKEKAIQLPEPKRPSEVDKINDPKYCRYHRIISHPLSECYILKNIIQKMINDGEIEVDSSSRAPTAASNSISLLEEEPKSTLPCPLGAKPNNVEKIKKTLNVKAESSSLPNLYELMTEAKLEFWENSSKDGNEEEWQTYIGKKSKKMAKRPLPIIIPFEKSGIKIHGRKDSKKNKKKKKNTQEKSMSLEEEKYIQSERTPITLVEYLPKGFLQNHFEDEMKEEVVQCCMVSIDDNEREVDEVTLLSSQHLSLLQKEKLNQNAKDDASKGKEGNSSQPLSPRLLMRTSSLGKKFQNKFLYVKGTIGDVWLSRILLDYGSTVNFLPYKTFKVMGMNSKQLSPSNLTIQSFNQVGQRAMGSISLKVEIGELYPEALFHVIDVDTSYNVLLGRPWVHTYGIIGSTLHQCFKLCDEDGNVKMV
ncbi:hypothetical protein ACB092_07G071000 [Castanea dentata]